ncbi:hypothetical protein [Mesorhizobium sp.]|uniref:hypothetical protein n=1 Tax=Mesorhizobium sp. TaxID=1871066 RepID=UPI0025D25E00|nr:hypothetical protein [Mesorhizobium sp.]
MKKGATVLRPEVLAVPNSQAWRSSVSIEDHCTANVVSKHRRIGDELDCASQADSADPGFNVAGEIYHSEDFRVRASAGQDSRRDRIVQGKEHRVGPRNAALANFDARNLFRVPGKNLRSTIQLKRVAIRLALKKDSSPGRIGSSLIKA